MRSVFIALFVITSCGPKYHPSQLKDTSGPLYRSTRWFDGRPKLILDPTDQPFGFNGEMLVREWLKNNATLLHINPRLTDLRLESIRRSTEGVHYVFVTPDGIGTVRDSVIIVSTVLDGSSIYRVYNGLAVRTNALVSPVIKLSKEDAINAAWKHLAPTGKLLSEPTAELETRNVGGKRSTWWRVVLDVNAPAGSWEYLLDPTSGRVISQEDLRVYTHAPQRNDASAYGPKISLHDALAELHERQSINFTNSPGHPATGSAKLFVVDPRTALARDDLADNTAADVFKPAYEIRTLDNITRTQQGYRLSNSGVTLEDWDGPFVAPSISPDGTWSAERGDNSFNDAMTFWHLNQARNYLDQLGYVGESRIFTGAIVADSTGADGADNSFFSPVNGYLTYGHGCIDDNEDPDVILHEMGHAIQYAINPWYRDGDTGAMGEGFGDYWAVSNGYNDPRNLAREPAKVFNWDGSAGCWDGRHVDNDAAHYNRARVYHAHANVDGFIADELWSTPLSETLAELVSLGVNRSDVDRIVIESQFGLAHSLTMPDWANALVQTAAILYPQGPHAQIFAKHFATQLIMGPREPDLTSGAVNFTESGNNHVPDPGETVALQISVKNIGEAVAQSVSAKLVSLSPWITVVKGDGRYGDILDLHEGALAEPFRISVDPNAACGIDSQMQLVIRDAQSHEFKVPFDFPLGVPGGQYMTAQSTPNMDLPDHDLSGITDAIVVTGHDDMQVRTGFSVDVAIDHPMITDLKISLIAPDGREIILKSFLSGERTDTNIIGNYPNTLQPVEDLTQLENIPMNGTWKLHVIDGFEGGRGKLLAWGIKNPTGQALCEHH